MCVFVFSKQDTRNGIAFLLTEEEASLTYKWLVFGDEEKKRMIQKVIKRSVGSGPQEKSFVVRINKVQK